MSSIENSPSLPNNPVVRPIPPGEHSVTPYLTVNNGSNAIEIAYSLFQKESEKATLNRRVGRLLSPSFLNHRLPAGRHLPGHRLSFSFAFLPAACILPA